MDSAGFQFSDQADQVGQISSEPIIDQSDALARDHQLPNVELNSTGLKISPLENNVPKRKPTNCGTGSMECSRM